MLRLVVEVLGADELVIGAKEQVAIALEALGSVRVVSVEEVKEPPRFEQLRMEQYITQGARK